MNNEHNNTQNNTQSDQNKEHDQPAQSSKPEQSGNSISTASQAKSDSSSSVSQIKSDSASANSQTKNASTELSAETVKDTAKGLYDQAKSTAGQAYGVATKRATEVLDEKKEVLTGGLTSVADSIKQFGETLNKTEEKNPITETAAKYTNGLAEQIEGVANYFERKDVKDMIGDVETFARKYPAYFIGGAVAVGFLAARFLKSSQPKQLAKAAGQSFGKKQNAVNPS